MSPHAVTLALLLTVGAVPAVEPVAPLSDEHLPDHRHTDHDTVKRLRDSGRILPLDTILQRHRATHRDGRVLEAELEWEGGHYVYELEILHPDGTVREWEYDAGSGELWRVELED